MKVGMSPSHLLMRCHSTKMKGGVVTIRRMGPIYNLPVKQYDWAIRREWR